MASIARGLETGINLGFRFDQALREKERRDALRAATEDKSFAKYSPEQGAQMRAEADMVDELGRPKYQYSIEPGSTTYTRREITYPGAPTVTEGMSFGDPTYKGGLDDYPQDYAAPYTPTIYRTPTGAAGPDYAFTPNLIGEAVYNPEQTQAARGGLESVGGTRGLTARETNISRPIEAGAERPEDSAAYIGLMRQLGAPTTMAAPELTEYLGQTVKGGLGKEQQRSMLLDRYADIISRDDPVEGMKLRAMALQEKIGSYQLKQIERGEKQDIAEEKLLEELKARPELLQGDLTQLFSERGIRPERANKMVEGVLGLEGGTIKMMTTKVDKAYRAAKGDLNRFLQSTLDDEDYDPTSHMVARKGPRGGVVIDVVETLPDGRAGRVISSLPEQANQLEALDTAYNMLVNPGQAAQTALKNQKTREEIDYMRKHGKYFESMGEAYKSGARGGRADTTERDISGRVTSLNTILTQNRETIKDIDAQLKDLGSRKDEASIKQKDALTKQRNELNQDSEEIRKELSGIRRTSKFSGDGGDGGGLSRDGYKVGDVVSYIDPSGKTVQARFKGGENKQENWEPITASSTTGTSASKGLEKPSGKGMSEKQYEDWIDDKLIGAFTSRVQQLQAIIKDNPNPQIKAAAQRLLEKEKTRPQAGGVDAPL